MQATEIEIGGANWAKWQNCNAEEIQCVLDIQTDNQKEKINSELFL